MWEKLRVVWQIPELRKKILLTLGLLAVYRLGFQIPLPIVDPAKRRAASTQSGGMADMLEAGGRVQRQPAAARSRSSAWGSCRTFRRRSSSSSWAASIRRWNELQKEGEAGRKKINEYTRYATVLHLHHPELDLRRVVRRSRSGLVDPGVLDADRAT